VSTLDAALDAIVKAYDVRGLLDDLTPEVAEALGRGAAEVLLPDGGRLVVGHDMRPSSPELVAAFSAGVLARGRDVVDIGLAATDQLYFASGLLDAPGAIFTASHNPPEYNGIKFCRAGASPVAIDSGLATIAEVARARLEDAPTPGTATQDDLLERYATHVRSFVSDGPLASSETRPVRVVVDAGNGMAGHVWPAVAEGLAIETIPLYFELDGSFPNHPANPLDARNLIDLQAAVRAHGAACGLAFDGDADRVFVVDEHGDAISSSLIGAVVATRLLARHPGATVLHNLICSQVVPEAIEAAGGVPVRTRVGHSFIKARMADTDAIYAVEHSGHHYFRDNFRADSGAIAAVVVLDALAVAGRPASEVVAPFDRTATSGEHDVEVADAAAVLEAVAAAFADARSLDREDGLTVVTEAGWFNLRPSNTEPVLRLNVEADDQPQVDALLAQVRATIDAAGASTEPHGLP
jgi:phosphomannomutase